MAEYSELGKEYKKIQDEFISQFLSLFLDLQKRVSLLNEPASEPTSVEPSVKPDYSKWKAPSWWDTFRHHGLMGLGKRFFKGTKPEEDSVWQKINPQESTWLTLKGYLLIEEISKEITDEFFQINEASPEIQKIVLDFKVRIVGLLKTTGRKLFELGKRYGASKVAAISSPSSPETEISPEPVQTGTFKSEPELAMGTNMPYVSTATDVPDEPQPVIQQPVTPSIPTSKSAEDVLKSAGFKGMQIKALEKRGNETLNKTVEFVSKPKNNTTDFAKAALGEDLYHKLEKLNYKPNLWFKLPQGDLPTIQFVDHQSQDAIEALTDVCIALKRGDLFKMVIDPKSREAQDNIMSLLPGPGVLYKGKFKVFEELKQALGVVEDEEVNQHIDSQAAEKHPGSSVVDKAPKSSGKKSVYRKKMGSLFDKFGEPNY